MTTNWNILPSLVFRGITRKEWVISLFHVPQNHVGQPEQFFNLGSTLRQWPSRPYSFIPANVLPAAIGYDMLGQKPFWTQCKGIFASARTEKRSFSHIFTTLNVSKGVPSCTTQFITNVTSFDPFFGPSSDLYYRSHKRNNTNYLYTFVINFIVHNGTFLGTFIDLSTTRMSHLEIKIYYANWAASASADTKLLLYHNNSIHSPKICKFSPQN